MQNFINFLVENERIIDLIQTVFFFVLAVMLYRKTGNINYIMEVFDDMRYRTESYKVTEQVNENGEVQQVVIRDAQSFNNLVPVYRLNKVTNELEKTDEFIDIQEQIESFKEQALQSMLDRFMPKLEEGTADFSNITNDLDMLTESFNIAEEYREKLGLDASLSVQQVFSKMNEYSQNLKKKLENGGKNDEKENEPKN